MHVCLNNMNINLASELRITFRWAAGTELPTKTLVLKCVSEISQFPRRNLNSATPLKVLCGSVCKNVVPLDVFWSCVVCCIKLYLYVVICRKIQSLSISSGMMTVMMTIATMLMMIMTIMTSLRAITHLLSWLLRVSSTKLCVQMLLLLLKRSVLTGARTFLWHNFGLNTKIL